MIEEHDDRPFRPFLNGILCQESVKLILHFSCNTCEARVLHFAVFLLPFEDRKTVRAVIVLGIFHISISQIGCAADQRCRGNFFRSFADILGLADVIASDSSDA